MFLQTGGGGKGTRSHSAQQQQNHSQHHQTSSHHQQNRTTQEQQQSQHQQQGGPQLTHTLYVSQQHNAAPHNNNHYPHTHGPPQQATHQSAGGLNAQQLQQLQHHNREQQQQHLQAAQQIYYASQPPPSVHYGTHSSSGNSSSSGGGGGTAGTLQQVSSNTSLQHANGVLGNSAGATNVVHALNNANIPHYPPSAGLITPTAGSAPAPGATYITSTYLPFNHPGSLLGAPAMAFQANAQPSNAGPASYFTTVPSQKQLAPSHHLAGGGAAAQGPQPIYYHTLQPAPHSNGNGTHRSGGRSQRSSTPQHTNYFTTYAMPTAPPPRATLINPNSTGVAPMINSRGAALNGTAAFHMPQTFCPTIQMGPPTGLAPTQLLAPAGMAVGSPVTTGLHSYQPNIQSNPVTAGLGSGFTAGPLPAAQPVGEKVKERKFAIPIIHPDTKENVLDPNSTVFINKETNSALQTDSGADSVEQNENRLYQEPATTTVPFVQSAVKVDYQMQTEKTLPQIPDSIQNITEGCDFDEMHQESVTACSVTESLEITTNEKQISVIVKDILANSAGQTEDMSFWQDSDVDKAANTYARLPFVGPGKSQHITKADLVPTSGSSQTVLCKEHDKKQRPKSANKQSTATPTSIANAVAEAAASGGASITILARSQLMPQLQSPTAVQAEQEPDPQNNMKSISTTAAPLTVEGVKVTNPTSTDRNSPTKNTRNTQSNSPNKKTQQTHQMKQQKQQQQTQQQQQQQKHPSSTSSSNASSSTASTPTHQFNQQKQHMKQTSKADGIATTGANNFFISPAVAMLAGTAPIASVGNQKKQRKQQKRAKDQEKRKQKAAAASTTTAASCSINNNGKVGESVNSNNLGLNNNNQINNNINKNGNNATKVESAVTLTTYVTTTKTTAVVVSASTLDKAAKPTTDKHSSTSNNPSISSNLREGAKQQQSKEQAQEKKKPEPNSIKKNNGNESKNEPSSSASTLIVESKKSIELLTTCSNTASSQSLPENNMHMATKDIEARFLNKSRTDMEQQSEAHQLQFLNSSASVCEDDDQEHISLIDYTSVEDLKFGDFNEEKLQESDFICSSTWSSSSPLVPQMGSLETSVLTTVNSTTSITTVVTIETEETSRGTDNIDCAPKTAILTHARDSSASSECESRKNSPVQQNSPVHQQDSFESQTTDSMLKATAPKFIRYSITELRDLSKLSLSRKPPMVPCQKGDCIAQLFVSRPQIQHHLTPHISQYQHMNFNESLDYVTGKRGRSHGHNANKKHHEYQQMGGAHNHMNAGSGAPNQSRHMDIIRVQLSLKEEIKLSECENAWQPDMLRRMSMMSAAEEDDDVDAVVKKVRGILNKLTPNNFDVLLKEMSSIRMETEDKMTNVMLLIFEKTISEPNFANTYARFCKVLFHEIKAENKSLFTSSLITRIQHEFESNVNDANAKTKKLQPLVDRIKACTEANKKVELQAEMEDLEYQFRRRAWGTVRFIGELFKLETLNRERVLHCVESLLDHGCEEKLEYMCKLLTTVGHLLEGNSPDHYQYNVRIDKIFRKIQDNVNKSRGTAHRQPSIKISSRVRFMLQDVLDLRTRNWDQPAGAQQNTGRQRPNNSNMANKVEEKQQQQGRGNVGGNQHQQQKRQSMGNSRHNDNYGHDSGNYFMHKMAQPQQNENHSLSIDPSKLRFCSANDETSIGMPKLGSSSHYQPLQWRNTTNRSGGTGGGGNVAPVPTQTPNTLLKRIPKQPPSQTITYSPYQQPTSVKSGSVSTCKTSTSPIRANAAPEQHVKESFTQQQCQEVITKLVEEFLNTRDWKSEVLAMWRICHVKQQSAVFHYLLMDYLHRATVKRAQRLACANIFSHLMRQQVFDKSTFAQVYASFAEEFPDLLVDVPNGWTYVFEFLGPIMHERMLNFNDIWQRRWLEDSHFTDRFVRAFISYFANEFGANYARDLWHKAYKLDRGQLFWNDALKYRDFLQSNSFQFLEQSGKQMNAKLNYAGKTLRTPTEHVERISYLLKSSNDCDMAIDYINTNVNINTNFVRQLTKFLCCDYALTVMTNNNNTKDPIKLNVQLFKRKCTPLLRLCIDAQEAHEIACIDETVNALQQHFLAEVEDEMGAGDIICATFSVLYECEVIPKESFDKWYKLEMENTSKCRRPFIDKLRMFIEDLF